MTSGQKKTARVLMLAGAMAFVYFAGLLVWEFKALAMNDQASISEVIWVAWAHQPGPIALMLIIVAHVSGWLGGHFLWQSANVYDKARHEQ